MTSWRRWFGAVAAAALVAAAGAAQPRAEDPVAELDLDRGAPGWQGLRLGLSAVQVERRVGATLALRARRSGEEVEVCAPVVAEAEFGGARLVLGFPNARPGAKLESLWVRFRGVQANAAELARALRARAPSTVYLPAPGGDTAVESADPMPTYSLPGEPPAAIRFVPESGMLLARRDCLESSS